MGTNLSVIADYSPEWTFVDAFKASRDWISGSASAWDDRRALQTDANGWVTALQPGQIARTLLFWGLKTYPGGTYVVLFDGEGAIQYFGGAAIDAARSVPGRHVLQVTPARGGIGINIVATTPGNPIRNIRVIMPGGICEDEPFRYAANAFACGRRAGRFRSFEAHHASIVFHPAFLRRIRNYRLLRFMDWGRTNNSPQFAWSDRPRLADARWTTKGVPLEVMVELANRIGADAWFSIPHLADDDYVARYARLVGQLLRRDLNAYVEYSNEVWNGQFAQARYARDQGRARKLSADPYQAQLFFYSLRSTEIFNLWREEFRRRPSPRRGPPPRSWGRSGHAQLVRVMATQAANAWTAEQVLDFRNAREQTDVLAIAPYFGSYLGSPGERSRVAAMSVSELFTELENVALPQAIGWMRDQAAVARARGLSLAAYEGGQHLMGYSGIENDPAVTSLFIQANRDPRMGLLYRRYLDAWKASGATVLAHYLNCGPYTKWGSWGALEFLEQARADSPKYDALQTFIERNPAWW